MNTPDISRRKFIKTLSYAGGTLLIGGAGSYFFFKDPRTPDIIQDRLQRKLKGKVIVDKLLIEEYRTDFGHTLRKEPRVIVAPENDDDIIKIFQIANEFQVPVSIRGAGHTVYGQSLSDGGILLVNNSATSGITLTNDRVSVLSKTQWLILEKELNQHNLTSPILTDYLALTVGGTLSVGGYGLRSFQYGAQVDNIVDMEIISPDGKKELCSLDQHSDLFRYALCGLGQLGFINRVTFKPIRYKKITYVFYITSRTVTDFIDTLKDILGPQLINEIDHFSAYWVNGTFITEIGKSFTGKDSTKLRDVSKKMLKSVKFYKQAKIKDYHFYLHNIREKWVEQHGISHRLWEDYIFDIDGLKEFLDRTIVKEKIHRQQNILPALYFVACNTKKSKKIPFSPTYGIRGDMVYSVGFYYMIKFGDRENLAIAKNQLNQNMKHCIDIGGKPYLYGWHGLNEDQKIRLYGADFEKLKRLKKIYDPKNLLNPGVFLTSI